MQIKTILRLLGLLLMLFSGSMLPSLALSVWFQDCSPMPYLMGFLLTAGSGFLCWFLFRRHNNELKIRDGFFIVVLFWTVLCLFAAIPFMIAPHPHETFTDAMFESVSGFTTTGATVVRGINSLSHAMLYYRQQLQFLGGMGIVVLAVAILPMLGVGGMQLYRAETPGPLKESKLTPRITSTAKRLWTIYVGLTFVCALSYWLAGMDWFDALGESFATISTGGFSMHDSSFEYYNSDLIEMVGSFFMIVGAANFSLHFLALRGKTWRCYWHDEEFRTFIFLLSVTALSVAIVLWIYHIYSHPETALVKSVFNVVSLMSTTGFVSAPFSQWPSYAPILIMFVALIGGCAGSTSGGMKVMRILLLKKQSVREIMRLLHPQAVVTLKFAKQAMPERVLQAMWGFIAAFISLSVILLLILMATGLDLTTAFGALVATLANAGAGLGAASVNFHGINTIAKWVLMFAMLAGRLEIFTLLVLFSPAFWRR